MFITDVNTASKQDVKSVRMHETARRLHEAARKMKGATTLTSVANLLGETVQTVKNWEARGVSQGGQVKARERIGCDTHWLATGEGPMSAAHPAASAPRSPDAVEPVASSSGVVATLERLGELLARATPQTRASVSALLVQYAQDPANNARIAQAIELLLSHDGSQHP